MKLNQSRSSRQCYHSAKARGVEPGLGIRTVPFPQHVNVSSETRHMFLIIGMNKQSTVGWQAVHCER